MSIEKSVLTIAKDGIFISMANDFEYVLFELIFLRIQTRLSLMYVLAS